MSFASDVADAFGGVFGGGGSGGVAGAVGRDLATDIGMRLSGQGGLQGSAGTPTSGAGSSAASAGRSDVLSLLAGGTGGGVSGAAGTAGTAGSPILEAARLEAEAQQRAIDEIRRQFDITQASLDPFIDAGTGALPEVERASTISGFGERLGEIFGGGSLDALIAERTQAAQGQLGSVGLSRSGTALETVAAIPQDLGLMIESLLSGRSTNLANLGASTAVGAGQFGAQAAGTIAGFEAGIGESQAAGILTLEQFLAEQRSQDLQLQAAKDANKAQKSSDIFKFVGSLLFSDPRLKINIMQIGEIGDLGLYQWDWIPEATGTIIAECPTVGFMADEIEEKYPDYVGEFGGWKYVHYPELLDLIENKIKQPEPAFA